jgi:hypothetical protein
VVRVRPSVRPYPPPRVSGVAVRPERDPVRPGTSLALVLLLAVIVIAAAVQLSRAANL